MSPQTRREFIGVALAAGAAQFTHQGGWHECLAPVPATFSARLATAQSAEPFAGGVLVGTLPLFGRSAASPPLGTMIRTGLDARLFTDLTALSSDNLITPNDRFYIRTACPDLIDYSHGWTLTLRGLASQAMKVSLDDLAAHAVPVGTHLLECAGNNDPNNFGLMSAARWSGVPIEHVLDRLGRVGSMRILISGFDDHSHSSRTSTPGASWIFHRDDLELFGAFLATAMNGVSLPRNHGFPVRLVVPRWYGCACIKWVNAIELVADDAKATTQMREFASRTFQNGVPERARDYRPAAIDHAATPVRVEKWVVNGRVLYRVVGILWGGAEPTNALAIRFKSDEPYVRVHACPMPSSTTTWTLWWHAWRPPSRGRYDIVLKIDDPKIRSARLDIYYYVRSVDIDEV